MWSLPILKLTQMTLSSRLYTFASPKHCALPQISPSFPLKYPPILTRSLPFASHFRRASLSFSTRSTAMGDAVDAGMDAVQRRLMFEDEWVTFLSVLSFVVFNLFGCWENQGNWTKMELFGWIFVSARLSRSCSCS